MEDFFESIPLLIAAAEKQDIGTTLNDVSTLQGLVTKLKTTGASALASLDLATLRSDVKAALRTITLADSLLSDQAHGAQAVTLLKKVLG